MLHGSFSLLPVPNWLIPSPEGPFASLELPSSPGVTGNGGACYHQRASTSFSTLGFSVLVIIKIVDGGPASIDSMS